MQPETNINADVDRILKCRQIAQEIVRFGVTQEELLLIIQYLGFELENHDQMVEVVGMTKEFLKPSQVLLLDKSEV